MVATPTSNLSFQNFFSATLSSDITSTSTDIFLDTIPNGSEGFLVIDPDSTSGREVIYYNSKTATKVVCPSVADGRGQDDTTAGAHLQGTTVIMAPVAAFYEALLALFLTSPQGWAASGAAVSSVTNNGNRSYTLVTGTDVSSLLSPGMRVKTTRTVAAPTRSTSLNGTTQYWNKTSPSGMTFTDDFACGAWVYLTSYPASGAGIMSRFNGTSGFVMQITATGQVLLGGHNAGVANSSYILSTQSIPLNKWVHIAAQLDMSAFTATTTTSYVMFDGINIASSVTRTGTNPTALVQAGNLEIGSWNASNFLAAKIAQAWVSSAKITQATIQSFMNEGLTSAVIAANNIISAYSFDGVATDLNTGNANNLSANGSATATDATSPFGTQSYGTISSTLDYGIIQSISGTTVVVQVPAGNTIATSGGISSLAYSVYDSPYGFPKNPNLWTIEVPLNTTPTKTTVTNNVWYGDTALSPTGPSIVVPIGNWNLGYDASIGVTAGVSGFASAASTLSTSASTASDKDFIGSIQVGGSGSSVTLATVNVVKNKNITLAAATTYYLNLLTSNSGNVRFSNSFDSNTSAVIKAVNAYL